MAATDIIITEILYDPIQKNSGDKLHEWVEIKNTGTTAVDLTGWKLDDSNTGGSVGLFLDNVVLQPGQIAILFNGNITAADIAIDFPGIPVGTAFVRVSPWQQLNNTGGDAVNLYDNAAVPNLITSVPYVDDAAPGQSLSYTNTGAYEGAGAPDPGVVTCFTAGSLVDTERGPCRIEDLQLGDRVHTLDHGLQPLRWVGRRLVSAAEQRLNPALCPVEIEQGALGPQAPLRRTRVSPQHRLLVAGAATDALFGQPRMLCAAIALAGQGGIRQVLPAGPVEYIHLLFDQHEVIFADGQPSESFFPSQEGIAALSPLAREELFTLFPELESAAFPVAYPVMSPAEAALLSL